MPGAGMFELATAAARSLLPEREGTLLCLGGVAIPSPVVLSGPAGAAAAEASLDCRTGGVELATLSGKGAGASTLCVAGD